MKTLRLLLVLITCLVLTGRSDRTSATTLTTLYSFIGGSDGAEPPSALVQGGDSNLYGVTYGGGLYGAGTVFQISAEGTLTTLYSFTDGLDGSQPRGALVLGRDGNFYGTTYSGGLEKSVGTVFTINSSGDLTTLYRFSSYSDGADPYSGLVEGNDNYFYGTTYSGGVSNVGTAFKISPEGTLTTLHGFSGGTDGANPMAALVLGTDSNFYGTTYGGGYSNGAGVVFSINSTGLLSTVYEFTGGSDGGYPMASLIEGRTKHFYGTTYAGGDYGSGTVFQVTTTGALTVLHNFTGGADGGYPEAGLIIGSDGYFYGTTSAGGSAGDGTVFKISSGGALTTLQSFGGTNGANPVAGLVQGNVSNFYGTTFAGGTDNAGTVFTLVQPCSYSLSPSHVTLPASDDSGTFTITPGNTNCPWTATSMVDWITITSSTNGLGSGTVSYSVTANTSGNARTGTIDVEGKAFTVTQQSLVYGSFLLGTYNGLVLQADSPSQASSGFISLALSKTGAFAARLTIGGADSTFKGVFDSSGNATNTVARKNLTSLNVILHVLTLSNDTDQIVGTVSDGTFTSDLLADLAVFTRLNPCPWAGRYTYVLEPLDDSDPTVPQGFGYGTLTVSTTGSGQMRGVLGDGTKISSVVPVSGYGTWPLYASLYKNQGSCLGLISFATNDTLSATVNWFKPSGTTGYDYPDGFTTAPTLTGAIYVSPKAGGPSIAASGQLTLGGGNLESNLVKSVVITASGNVTVSPTGSDQLTLKINPVTGQFSGGFLNPAVSKTVKLGGFLLQIDNSGAGYFPGTNQTGFVIFEPTR